MVVRVGVALPFGVLCLVSLSDPEVGGGVADGCVSESWEMKCAGEGILITWCPAWHEHTWLPWLSPNMTMAVRAIRCETPNTVFFFFWRGRNLTCCVRLCRGG